MTALRGLSGGVIVVAMIWASSALAKPLSPRDAGGEAPPLAVAAGAAPLAPPRSMAATDRATIQKLHDANQMEIQMGRLAAEKGSKRAVKDFGRVLMADHALADRKLDELLRKRGADIKTLATVTSADPDHEMLATTTGAAFDRAFGLQMIADHTKAIDMLESARLGTEDDTLRDLFNDLLTTLRAHKRAAQDIVASTAGV